MREGGREGGRERGREGGREGGRERGREGEREMQCVVWSYCNTHCGGRGGEGMIQPGRGRGERRRQVKGDGDAGLYCELLCRTYFTGNCTCGTLHLTYMACTGGEREGRERGRGRSEEEREEEENRMTMSLVLSSSSFCLALINPRRACAARVTVVVLCVCVCVFVCPIENLKNGCVKHRTEPRFVH